MIDDLEKSGILNKDSVIIEPTSGNTGIALAFVAASKGYRMILCMPESMSVERRKILKFLGAELELTPAAKGMKGAIERAEELKGKIDHAIIPQQFANPANQIHENTTAFEIIKDTKDFDVFVAVLEQVNTQDGRIFKEKGLNIYMVAVNQKILQFYQEENQTHKIQGIGAGFIRYYGNRAFR